MKESKREKMLPLGLEPHGQLSPKNKTLYNCNTLFLGTSFSILRRTFSRCLVTIDRHKQNHLRLRFFRKNDIAALP